MTSGNPQTRGDPFVPLQVDNGRASSRRKASIPSTHRLVTPSGPQALYTARMIQDEPTQVWVKSLFAGLLLSACVTVGACTTMAQQSVRAIVRLAPGVEIADHVAFQRLVLARTSVRVVYAAALSERMHAINIICESTDPDCGRAKEALMGTGLFTSIVDDQRRRAGGTHDGKE